jgi:hypothetical protein
MDSSKRFIDTIIGIIPILLIFSWVYFTKEFEDASQTILGKIVAVTTILLYTSIDKILGLFICLVVIFYYQNLFIDIFLKEEEEGGLNKNVENLFIETAQNEFRKENCDANGELMYKDMNVRNDIADLIFTELKFEHRKCNPCSQSCHFSIIESRMANEEKMKPISSV